MMHIPRGLSAALLAGLLTMTPALAAEPAAAGIVMKVTGQTNSRSAVPRGNPPGYRDPARTRGRAHLPPLSQMQARHRGWRNAGAQRGRFHHRWKGREELPGSLPTRLSARGKAPADGLRATCTSHPGQSRDHFRRTARPTG